MATRILVIDDDELIRKTLEKVLQGAGYEAILTEDARSAFATLKEAPPDLAIVDYMLPEMDGTEIIRKLREYAPTAAMPIIMLSARAAMEDKVLGLQAGADDYLAKPVVPAELLARIEALLARTRRLMGLSAQALKHGRVIGAIGAKGGVGTTTLVLNLALALTRGTKAVTALELHSYHGSFASYLTVQPTETLSQMLDLDIKTLDPTTLRGHLMSSPTGLSFLFGPQQISEFKTVSSEFATALIEGLALISDFVVIDLPSQPGLAAWGAAQVCDFMLVVVEPDPVCLEAGRLTVELLKSWNLGVAKIGAVVENHGMIATQAPLDEVSEHMGCKVMGIVPPMWDVITAAQHEGVPVVMYKPDHIASTKLVEIAERLSAERIVPYNP